jgi:hypothetical protein
MNTSVTMEWIAEASPRLKARIAGGSYSIIIVAGIFAVGGRQANHFLQIAQLARGAPDLELAIAADDGDSGRVVAAVFKPFQPVQDDGHHLLRLDEPTIPHMLCLPLLRLGLDSLWRSTFNDGAQFGAVGGGGSVSESSFLLGYPTRAPPGVS